MWPNRTRTRGLLLGGSNIIDGYDWAVYRRRVEAGAREAEERAES